MTAACDATAQIGIVREVLTAVDCNTRGFAAAGYQALAGAHSPVQQALVPLLTIYVAFIGYRMVLAPDGARLADGVWAALKIGVVLTLATNWSVFQTLVFAIVDKAPLELARTVSKAAAGHSALAGDPVGGLQVAYDQLVLAAAGLGKPAVAGGTVIAATAPGSAAGVLRMATSVLFMASVGVVCVTLVAGAILAAVGPLFVVLFLLPQTRGLFVGWIRAFAVVCIWSLVSWVSIVLMLAMLEPWLVLLARQREVNMLDEGTAVTAASLVFVFAACQIALLAAGGVIGLGLSARWPAAAAGWLPERAPQPVAGPRPVGERARSRAETLAEQLRQIQTAQSNNHRVRVVDFATLAERSSSRGARTDPAAPQRSRPIIGRPWLTRPARTG